MWGKESKVPVVGLRVPSLEAWKARQEEGLVESAMGIEGGQQVWFRCPAPLLKAPLCGLNPF